MAVVSMSDREFARLDVLLNLEAGRIRVADAGALLGLERRQVFRLLQGFRERGAGSLVSSRRGRPSNRFYANLVLTEQRFQRGHRPASALNLQAA